MTDPISLSFHEILSLYHQFGFERRLNPKANKIAIGILTKWDRLLHPDSFIMGNIELAEIAGLDHNKVNISRNRSLVIKRCTVNAVPLFGYISNGQKQPGTYIVNIQAFTYDYKEKVIIPTSQKPIPPLVLELRASYDECLPSRRYTHSELRNWQELKKELLEEITRCEACGLKSMLELHHRTYINWGHETRDDVVLLCRKCHRKVHSSGDVNG